MGEHVPSGYKQTKVGVIPEDWDVVKLEEISDFITKGATPTTYGFEWQDSGIPFLRSECVSDDGLNLKAAMFISEDANRHMKRSEIKTGDLLMTITGNVGRVVLLKKPFISGNINQHIARIRIVSEDANREFINYFISQNKYRINYYKITTGQAYPQISLAQVRDSIVPLPPLKEQQRIAQVLATWDDAISKQEELIEAKEELKQGLMQKLLSGEVRFDGFDGEWEEVRLGNVATLTSSKRVYLSEYVPDGIPFYRGKEISELKSNMPIKDLLYISESKYLEIKNKYGVPQENDILITAVGTLGNLLRVKNNDKFYFKDGNLIWIKDIKGSSVFLDYLLQYEKNKVLSSSIGSSQKALTIVALNKIKIKLPSKEEQEKIAAVLTLVDKEIDLLKNELDALKEQKHGLMQRLLSGEVRTNKIRERE